MSSRPLAPEAFHLIRTPLIWLSISDSRVREVTPKGGFSISWLRFGKIYYRLVDSGNGCGDFLVTLCLEGPRLIVDRGPFVLGPKDCVAQT